MKCQILHETKNRMRVHFCKENMTVEEADKADAYLKSIGGIEDVTVYERTSDLIIYYSFDRSELIEILAQFSFENDEVKNIEVVGTARLVQREYEEKLIMTIALRYFRKIFYRKDSDKSLGRFRGFSVEADSKWQKRARR